MIESSQSTKTFNVSIFRTNQCFHASIFELFDFFQLSPDERTSSVNDRAHSMLMLLFRSQFCYFMLSYYEED